MKGLMSASVWQKWDKIGSTHARDERDEADMPRLAISNVFDVRMKGEERKKREREKRIKTQKGSGR